MPREKQPNNFVSSQLPPTWIVVAAIIIVFGIVASQKGVFDQPPKPAGPPSPAANYAHP